MSIPWNEIWWFTAVAAKVIGFTVIGSVAIAIVWGTFVWLWNCWLGCVNREIRTLRKFNRVLSNKVKELAEDKRFTAKERDDLYSFWFNACLDKEWGTRFASPKVTSQSVA